ncbi:WD40-repeat-containing domain protein, partial [Baffinella frigidus]
MSADRSTPKTALNLPEGTYQLSGAYSCQSNTHSSSPQRVFKASYAKVNAVRLTSPSPKTKSKLSFTKRSTPPTPLPQAVSGEGVEFLIYPNGDCLCVVNLTALMAREWPSNTHREKRYPSDPTSAAINVGVSSGDSLETLVGFENGEIHLIDAVTFAQTGKFNAAGALCSSRVADVQWLPGSATQFAATFGSGVMLIFDKDKDDGSAKSLQQATPLDASLNGDNSFTVTHPKSRNNPVSRWVVGRGPINSVAFSSDGKMTLCCHDGFARVFDLQGERLLFSFRSQYGAMLCAAWSPDNQYLVTPVALCLGHNSWLSSVAFDPLMCEANGGGNVDEGSNYRFHSV